MTDPAPDDLSALRADLESLRRRCLRLTVLSVGALAVAGYALLLERQRAHERPAQTAAAADVVAARTFVLRDGDGKPRGSLDFDPEGRPRLALMTPGGDIIAQLVGLANGARLVLSPPGGQTLVAEAKNTVAGMFMIDHRGERAARLVA